MYRFYYCRCVVGINANVPVKSKRKRSLWATPRHLNVWKMFWFKFPPPGQRPRSCSAVSSKLHAVIDCLLFIWQVERYPTTRYKSAYRAGNDYIYVKKKCPTFHARMIVVSTQPKRIIMEKTRCILNATILTDFQALYSYSSKYGVWYYFFPIWLPFTHSFTLAILCLFVYLNTAPSGRPGVDVLERFVVYEATYAENCRRSRRNFA